MSTNFWLNWGKSCLCQVEETAVIVVAGSWECSDNGIWDFVIAKECYARSITMRMSMTYEEFISNVTAEFELGEMNLEPKLSYWLPCQLSSFSVSRRPPVVITTTMGVRNFLNVRRSEVRLNLLLSLQPSSISEGSSWLRPICVSNEGANIPIYGSSGGIRMVTGGTSSAGSLRGNDQSKDNPVRRNLFGPCLDKGKGVMGEVGACSKPAMRDSRSGGGQISETSGGNSFEKGMRQTIVDPCLGTNYEWIINLADAATPPLSGDTCGDNEGLLGNDVDGTYLNANLGDEEIGTMGKHKEAEQQHTSNVIVDDNGGDKRESDSDGIALMGLQAQILKRMS